MDYASTVDQKRRQLVARELDRRSFWKAVYVAEVAAGRKSFAQQSADNALATFESTFKDLE
jgi:hypothetical protein